MMAAPSPPRFFAAWRVEAFSFFLVPASMGSTLGGLCDSRFSSAWIIILFSGKILLMIVVAHAILYLAFSSLLCGFVAAQL